MTNKAAKYFADHETSEGLGRASVRSGILIVGARGFNVVSQVASTLVLARLLGPHDFGLAAIVMALSGLAPVIIECGTTDAAVQRSKLTFDESSALFWLNILIGALLTIVFAAASSFLASAYGEPALSNLILVASTTFIVGAASIQHSALMRRALEFRRLAIIEIVSNVVGTMVAIAMAFAGFGYWSLVAKPLLIAVLTTIGVWASCPWVPGRPRYSAGAAELVRMGLGITGYTITDYLSRSADRLALGYFSGTGTVGNFQNAFLIYSNLLAFGEPLHNIAVASLSRLRDNLDELRQAWSRALSTLTFVAAAAFATLAVNAEDIVTILLGPKWTSVAPLVTVFAIRGIVHVAERTLGWLHIAAGRSDRWMRWGFIAAVCQLLALAAGLPFGAIGVAISYTIATYALVVPTLVYAGRPLGIGIKDVLGSIGPQVMSALATVLIGWLAQYILFAGLPMMLRLSLSIATCLLVYLSLASGVFGVSAPLRLAVSLVRDLPLLQPRRS